MFQSLMIQSFQGTVHMSEFGLDFVPVCAVIQTEHRLRTENGPNKTHAENLSDGKVRASHN